MFKGINTRRITASWRQKSEKNVYTLFLFATFISFQKLLSVDFFCLSYSEMCHKDDGCFSFSKHPVVISLHRVRVHHVQNARFCRWGTRDVITEAPPAKWADLVCRDLGWYIGLPPIMWNITSPQGCRIYVSKWSTKYVGTLLQYIRWYSVWSWGFAVF